MVIERIMISLAEREVSEGGLEIEDDKCDLWQSKETENCHSD